MAILIWLLVWFVTLRLYIYLRDAGLLLILLGFAVSWNVTGFKLLQCVLLGANFAIFNFCFNLIQVWLNFYFIIWPRLLSVWIFRILSKLSLFLTQTLLDLILHLDIFVLFSSQATHTGFLNGAQLFLSVLLASCALDYIWIHLFGQLLLLLKWSLICLSGRFFL